MSAATHDPPPSPAQALVAARRLVVKIGSALLATENGEVRRPWLGALADDVARFRSRGQEVILVSSGAIAVGRRHLGLAGRRLRLEEKQAAAATGQIRLAHAYQEALARHGITVAQILLTLDDTEERRRHLNARATFAQLLALGAVPVVNENDTIATAEIRFGDNDRLAARVAQMTSADMLVLLSDIDGLYTTDPRNDPHARHIALICEIGPEIEAMAGEAPLGYSSGGMVTKISAARIAMSAGCRMLIAKGKTTEDAPGPLAALEAGDRATLFLPRGEPRSARKTWIAGAVNPTGAVIVDDGAARALQRGTSLLPAGVIAVEGIFERGDAVIIRTRSGIEAGRGLSAYSSADIRRIAGHKSGEIAEILGYRGRHEIIHRDDLVVSRTPMTTETLSRERTIMAEPDLSAVMTEIGRRAREAATALSLAAAGDKVVALRGAAAAVRTRSEEVITANARDLAEAEDRGLAPALRDRLALDPKRVEAIAAGLDMIAALPDPVGRILAEWTRPNGLAIQRIAVPLGVIGIIYESRPNVTADAGGLALKSGNAAILRGGSESYHSSRALVMALAEGLRAAGLPEAAIQLVPTRDRAAVGLMLGMSDYIDVIVPRGGSSLIDRVQRESRIPVIAHLEGICHTYVDKMADPEKARAIVLNAKMRRVSICGATETLLIDRGVAADQLPAILAGLRAAGCELRGDPETRAIYPDVLSATEEDWRTEYLDAILSVRVVDGVAGAIAHINHYGSHHTDAIVTEDRRAAERFLREVDSAIVLVNASTQFADGGEFGMGAEIGISTERLPPRGPVGAEQLTTYKYLVRGTGQVRP